MLAHSRNGRRTMEAEKIEGFKIVRGQQRGEEIIVFAAAPEDNYNFGLACKRFKTTG
jgi:hypothetical protein